MGGGIVKGAGRGITTQRIDTCDYPGYPPPGWYRSWKAAMRDGVCGMGTPIYVGQSAATGGVYTEE